MIAELVEFVVELQYASPNARPVGVLTLDGRTYDVFVEEFKEHTNYQEVGESITIRDWFEIRRGE